MSDLQQAYDELVGDLRPVVRMHEMRGYGNVVRLVGHRVRESETRHV